MTPGRRPEPRISVFCRCGAQWHGRVVVDNVHIPAHLQRCGPPISGQRFIDLGYRAHFPKGWDDKDKFK